MRIIASLPTADLAWLAEPAPPTTATTTTTEMRSSTTSRSTSSHTMPPRGPTTTYQGPAPPTGARTEADLPTLASHKASGDNTDGPPANGAAHPTTATSAKGTNADNTDKTENAMNQDVDPQCMSDRRPPSIARH